LVRFVSRQNEQKKEIPAYAGNITLFPAIFTHANS